MIKIIAHRGLWEKSKEKNSLSSLRRAVFEGFGIETDLYGYQGEIVISHDIPSDKSPKLQNFFESIKNFKTYHKVLYAFNIKSDGLEVNLKNLIKKYGIKNNFFFFDMSPPTLYAFIKKFPPKNLATRMSEFEKSPPLFSNYCQWVWIDSFEKDWITEKEIKKLLKEKKKICFVSPEIHNRNEKILWNKLKKLKYLPKEEIYLCTDLVNKAKLFFEK